VNTDRFSPGPVGEHYVVVSELMPHKEIEIAVEAFRMLQRPLIIVGDGPDARRLKRLAGPQIQFTGRVSDETVAEILAGARALVVTSTEEFGIAAVESQAAGRPVIARHAGGVLETITDGVTGCFWSGGAAELAAAVSAFDDAAVDPQACVDNAARFDVKSFRRGILAEVRAASNADFRPGRSNRHPLPSTRLLRRTAREPHR